MTSSDCTADQIRADFEARLPGDLGSLFYILWSEVLSVHEIWATFSSLYLSGKPNRGLLDYCARSFFEDLEWILHDDVILRIRRVLDRPDYRGNPNASLYLLVERLKEYTPDLVPDIQALLKSVKSDASPLTTIGNKRVAHRDLDVALHSKGLGLADATLITNVLEQIGTIMNSIEEPYREEGEPRDYTDITARGNAESLLAYLRVARDHEHCGAINQQLP
jgi:AbiU2